MTGGEITTLRQRLGLSIGEFAQLLIVAESTAHRWEARAHHKAAVSGIHQNLLEYLKEWKGDPQVLRRNLLMYGPLTTLAYVLAPLLRST